jgi:hypothetical protein
MRWATLKRNWPIPGGKSIILVGAAGGGRVQEGASLTKGCLALKMEGTCKDVRVEEVWRKMEKSWETSEIGNVSQS